MKRVTTSTLFSIASLSASVAAQSISSGSAVSSPSITSASVIASGSGSVSGSSSVSSNISKTAATALTFSLTVTNPTAIPLSSITANETSLPTIALPTTYAAGSTPSISSAPVLPTAASISSANYPALDVVPPTDSPEVQQWIQEVANSGVSIPNITATVAGGCPANPEAATDTSRCWWTCGGCTRDTDITTCPDKLTWGLTYDDGPSFYTPNLLTYLDSVDLKATFFAVGSRCLQFPQTLQAEYMGGHQIAVHTWSHPSLSTLSTEAIIAELGWSKKIIKDVLGVTPNMMRPPYGDIDDRVRAISIAMGLTPVIWTRISATATFDTDDFDVHGGSASSFGTLNNWDAIVGNATQIDTGFIVLEHDLFEETVQLATGYILPSALNNTPAFDIKPVVSCLNKPLSDAYIETNDNATNPPAVSGSAVTLSSGAPGSAQATGGTSSGSSSGVSLTAGLGGSSSLVLLTGLALSLAVLHL